MYTPVPVEARALENIHAISVDNTLGAVFIGLVVASVLYGMGSLQTYLYYHTFQNDSLLHRVAVAILWALSTVHLAALVHTGYFYGITNFGDLKHVASTIVWTIKLSCLINVVIILIVQSLYAYRVWILGGYHRGVLGYIVTGVVAGGFIIGIVLVYMIYTTRSFPELPNISWAIDSSLAASTTIDFIISFAMCYYLRKSKGQISTLNSRISTLMQYCLSSGLLTSAISLSTLFTYTLLPNSLIFLGLQSLSTQLYVGSFMTMLNARNPAERQKTTLSGTKTGSSLHLNIKTPTSSYTYAGSAPSSSISEKKSPLWDLEAQHGPMLTIPLNTHQRSPLEKPEYAKNW